jgi:hypothetical protein
MTGIAVRGKKMAGVSGFFLLIRPAIRTIDCTPSGVPGGKINGEEAFE